MDHPRIVNERDVEPKEQAPDGRGLNRKQLARETGGEKLGCSLYVLDPEAASWPYHYHTANEEAIYVLEGRGTLHLAGSEVEIGPGDYVTFPANEDGAHRVVNTGDDALRYLCLSTMIEPDVTVYPDSETVGVFAGAPPGGRAEERTLGAFLRADADSEVDYWDPERE